MLTHQEFCELRRRIEENDEQVNHMREGYIRLNHRIRALELNTWTKEVDNHILVPSLTENPSPNTLTSYKKEEIALESTDEEEKLAGRVMKCVQYALIKQRWRM
ncbi:hypothetical protein AMTR_s00049p00183200 [Amborella trichopoda]|uniref:Uncharacterized protein n=1 Tax=Amborella trichopoda TaxID=13333 RepID=W1Q0V8_AMBTC|nr:hypothetical protein AMTR_s00049p00183200 [Amborella trichopoda]